MDADSVILVELMKKFGDDKFPLRNGLTDASDGILAIQFMGDLKAVDVRRNLAYKSTTRRAAKLEHVEFPILSSAGRRRCGWDQFRHEVGL